MLVKMDLTQIPVDTELLYSYCESDIDHEDDDDREDDVDIEQTIFQLSEHFTFVKRIHKHTHVGVYEAIDKCSPATRCCIKIIYKTQRSIPIEVRILRHINSQYVDSPRFPVLLYFFERGNTNVIVTKLEVETSFERLFNNTASTRAMCLQLIQAVMMLHSIHIIYRDMKVSNILWNDDAQQLVLCDFDLSTFQTEQGHTSVLGTDGYMSPEQTVFDISPPLTDTPPEPYGKSIDIYGIGAVLGTILFTTTEHDLEIDSVYQWRKCLRRHAEKSDLEMLFLNLTDPCVHTRISLEAALLLLQ